MNIRFILATFIILVLIFLAGLALQNNADFRIFKANNTTIIAENNDSEKISTGLCSKFNVAEEYCKCNNDSDCPQLVLDKDYCKYLPEDKVLNSSIDSTGTCFLEGGPVPKNLSQICDLGHGPPQTFCRPNHEADCFNKISRNIRIPLINGEIVSFVPKAALCEYRLYDYTDKIIHSVATKEVTFDYELDFSGTCGVGTCGAVYIWEIKNCSGDICLQFVTEGSYAFFSGATDLHETRCFSNHSEYIKLANLSANPDLDNRTILEECGIKEILMSNRTCQNSRFRAW